MDVGKTQLFPVELRKEILNRVQHAETRILFRNIAVLPQCNKLKLVFYIPQIIEATLYKVTTNKNTPNNKK